MTTPVSPTPITAAPPVPNSNDAEATFDAQFEASLAWQADDLRNGANALAAATYTNALAAVEAAEAAVEAGDAAVAAAHYKGPWSSLTGALAIPASVSHDGAVWALVSSVADVTAHEPGVSAQWLRLMAEIAPPAAAPGLVLIATLTPTAAANVDALTVFSSTYDDYLILLDGVQPAADQVLNLRFANAGVVDTSSLYFWARDSGTGGTYTSAFMADTAVASWGGLNAAIQVQNANSSGMKTLSRDVYMLSSDGSGYRCFKTSGWVYVGAAVSGIRFFWASGANFAAQGTIRIYGYSKT